MGMRRGHMFYLFLYRGKHESNLLYNDKAKSLDI